MEMTSLSSVINNDDMNKILAQFSRLGDRCYLENAGTVLYSQTLLDKIHADFTSHIYMNPHTDKYTKDCIEQIRFLTLKHFNTDPSKYTVIFTSGTTQSLKLVAESFEFASDPHEPLNCGSFVYLRDNHTSVLGLREIAAERNAEIIHISHDNFLKYIETENQTPSSPTAKWKEKYKNVENTLLVYPAQSNFNGFKYPLDCINNIKNGCLNNYIKKSLCKINCNWYVLLDAASYVSTNKLDLSKTEPDFVCLSFYKMFGYPTGLGALIVKNSSVHVLSQKKYFGGGTVDVVLSSEDFHVKRKSIQDRFEDGTQSFLSIIALKHCFDFLQEFIPKAIKGDVMETISHHTFYLAQDLYNQLCRLQHKNGVKAAILYMDSDFTDLKKQGGTVTFNLLRDDQSYIGYAEHMADLFEINVRTGCFCNSGSCQRHLHATNKEMKDMYAAGHKCGDDFDLLNGKPTGAVRASFSYYNTFEDVDKLMKMIHRCFLKVSFKKPKRQFYNKEYDINDNEKIKLNNIYQNLEKFNEEKQKGFKDANFKTIEVLPDPHNSAKLKNQALTEIHIYPVKSCGAFKINTTWKIGYKGFEYDREWMIIEDNGVCLTQKQNPRLCLIRPIVDLKKKLLILKYEGKPPIAISLNHKTDNIEKEATLCQTKVCTDIVKGIDCGDAVSDWLSEALETSYLRLIRQAKNDSRILKKSDKMLNLSNQAQFLLINKATVRWLGNKISDTSFNDTLEDLVDRFRGNLIVDMEKPLVEKDWERLLIGKHEFKVEGNCTRCQMVCINQQTGEKTIEPLRTISESFGGKIHFGIYLTYVGPIDGSKDNNLKIHSPIKAFNNEDDIR